MHCLPTRTCAGRTTSHSRAHTASPSAAASCAPRSVFGSWRWTRPATPANRPPEATLRREGRRGGAAAAGRSQRVESTRRASWSLGPRPLASWAMGMSTSYSGARLCHATPPSPRTPSERRRAAPLLRWRPVGGAVPPWLSAVAAVAPSDPAPDASVAVFARPRALTVSLGPPALQADHAEWPLDAQCALGGLRRFPYRSGHGLRRTLHLWHRRVWRPRPWLRSDAVPAPRCAASPHTPGSHILRTTPCPDRLSPSPLPLGSLRPPCPSAFEQTSA